MFRLRALILLLFSLNAQAEAPSAKIATAVKAEGGSTGINTSSAANATNKILSYDFSSGTINRSIFRLGLDQTFPDYGRVLITDRNGLSAPLSSRSSSPEFSIRPTLEFALPFIYLTFNGAKTISKSPYPATQGSITLAKELYQTGTKISANFSHAKTQAPSTYYIDPDSFQSLQRATVNRTNKLSASVEQILSERWKLKWKNAFSSRKNKPSYPDTELSFVWAISDQAAILSNTGASRELKNRKPNEDRGYLSAYWQELELRYEFSSRWNLKTKLGSVFETESARGAVPYQKVGTDYLGVVLQGSFSNIIASLNAKGSYANTGYRSVNFGGDFTWQF